MARKKTPSKRNDFAPAAWAVGGVVALGFVLQIALGAFPLALLGFPVNVFASGAIVLGCVCAGVVADSRAVRWLTGMPLAVMLISAFCALALIMGLTPQGATPMGGMAAGAARLGFNAMTTSWPFVLIYFGLLVALGSLVARRLASFRWRDWGFYLNHIGLWLVLFAAGLGHADMRRYHVQVDEGTAVRQGWDAATGAPAMLPVEVRLHDFVMELYPAAPGARPEPRRFASEVEITLYDGTATRGITEVNHPLRAGSWLVYQYGYDSAAGPESAYSIVELVRDPWLVPVYVGFAMVAAGAVAMIWKGRRRGGLE